MFLFFGIPEFRKLALSFASLNEQRQDWPSYKHLVDI
ncbi:MAG: hypothetical protein RL596_2471 [Bacteroidota bacterium]